MSVKDIRHGIEYVLETVEGLTVTPGALFLTMPKTSLPAAAVVINGPPERNGGSTGTADMTARYRAVIALAVGDPAAFQDAADEMNEAVAKALNRDPSLNGSCDWHSYSTEGQPQIDAELSPPIAAFTFIVEAHYEDIL